MRRTVTIGALLMLSLGLFCLPAFAGSPPPCDGANCPGNPTCPDADGDGICNGQDPDYIPDPDCSGNPTCPDADGDGICNGQDPDYTPGTSTGSHASLFQWLWSFLWGAELS